MRRGGWWTWAGCARRLQARLYATTKAERDKSRVRMQPCSSAKLRALVNDTGDRKGRGDSSDRQSSAACRGLRSRRVRQQAAAGAGAAGTGAGAER